MKCFWIFGHCWHMIESGQVYFKEKIHGRFGIITSRSHYYDELQECCKCGKKRKYTYDSKLPPSFNVVRGGTE